MGSGTTIKVPKADPWYQAEHAGLQASPGMSDSGARDLPGQCPLGVKSDQWSVYLIKAAAYNLVAAWQLSNKDDLLNLSPVPSNSTQREVMY